jgi:hypothetical protein
MVTRSLSLRTRFPPGVVPGRHGPARSSGGKCGSTARTSSNNGHLAIICCYAWIVSRRRAFWVHETAQGRQDFIIAANAIRVALLIFNSLIWSFLGHRISANNKPFKPHRLAGRKIQDIQDHHLYFTPRYIHCLNYLPRAGALL